MDVSIIIINYNTVKLTLNAINSILEKTKNLKYEIIVVDNGSTDKSVEVLEKLDRVRYKDVVFVKSKKNLGFGKGNNYGVKYSKGKYIFLLNSDTLLINNAVKELYEFMENNKNVGICGGNLYSEDLKPAHSFNESLPSIKNEILDIILFNKLKSIILKKRLDFNYSIKEKNVGYITGADLMIKKSLFKKIGEFDKDFFMYYEETELSNRVKQEGLAIVSLPKAKIIHLEGKSFKFKEFRSKTMYESRYKYYKKVYGKVNYLTYIVLQLNLCSKFILTRNRKYKEMMRINKSEYRKYKEIRREK